MINSMAATNAKLYVKSEKVYKEAFEILKIVNKERAAVGRKALTMDTALLDMAMTRSEETAIHFSHTRPTGRSVLTMSKRILGENIAAGQTSAKNVMKSWMNSPGHKENILRSNYSSIGIGCVKVNGIYYWTQIFGGSPVKTAKANQYKTIKGDSVITASAKFLAKDFSADVKKKNLRKGETTEITYLISNTFVKVPLLAKSATFKSSNENVCTVAANGKVTAVGGGTATISVYPKNNSGTKTTVKITVSGSTSPSSASTATTDIKAAAISYRRKAVYTGKQIRPAVTVKLGGKTLKLNTDYTVKYSKNKAVGNARITIQARGQYQGSVSKTFEIVPRTRKITNIRSTKRRTLHIIWNGTQKDVGGYQIQVSQKRNMKSAVTYTSKAGSNRRTINKLKSKTKYYVRVRGYRRASSKMHYGSWSKARAVSIK